MLESAVEAGQIASSSCSLWTALSMTRALGDERSGGSGSAPRGLAERAPKNAATTTDGREFGRRRIGRRVL